MRKDFIVRSTRIVAAVVAGLVVSSTTASALVLVEKSEEQKLRADIQKQTHGYVSCLVKAATNCEKSGLLIASECDLTTGTATGSANSKLKFAPDIAKCDAKLDFLKKAKLLTASTGYVAIGCPGDSNAGTPLVDEPYADMDGWQAATPAATKAQIKTLATALGAISGCDTLLTVKDQQKCQADLNKRVAGYAAAIQKCQLGCENDYKNKKGDGGNSDSATACSLNATASAGTGDLNFNACITKAYLKATKTALPALVDLLVMPALATALSDANNDVNNQNDCP